MKENFTIGIKNGYRFPNLGKIIIALIISAIIIKFSPLMNYGSITTILSFILLFLIIYVIFNSMSSTNPNDLPSTLYPSMPHTGLDGISLNNYVAGMDVNKYIV